MKLMDSTKTQFLLQVNGINTQTKLTFFSGYVGSSVPRAGEATALFPANQITIANQMLGSALTGF